MVCQLENSLESPRGREESDTTERLHFHFSLSCIGEGNGHPVISFSVIPFSSCFQSFPASESFPMNQFFASGVKVLEL